MAQKFLKQFRDEIRKAWLPVVGRERLTSYEYELTEHWYNEQIPLSLIQKAIKQVADRDHTVYSLGVIAADLEALKRQQAPAQVGAPAPAVQPDAWRTRWIEDLTATAGEIEFQNPELATRFRQLAQDIPELTREQAQRRWQELHR